MIMPHSYLGTPLSVSHKIRQNKKNPSLATEEITSSPVPNSAPATLVTVLQQELMEQSPPSHWLGRWEVTSKVMVLWPWWIEYCEHTATMTEDRSMWFDSETSGRFSPHCNAPSDHLTEDGTLGWLPEPGKTPSKISQPSGNSNLIGYSWKAKNSKNCNLHHNPSIFA